jgi:hypothetical protein
MVITTVPTWYFPTLNRTKRHVQKTPLTKATCSEYEHLISARKFVLHATSVPPNETTKVN